MKNNKSVIVFIVFIIVVTSIGLVFSFMTKNIENNKIQILDATYSCENILEDFYQDDVYIYSFPCPKSNHVYVKFEDGSKMLVINALKENKVTIKELEKAGLEIKKRKK